jgi:hypothetical protein
MIRWKSTGPTPQGFKPRTAYGIYHPDIGKHALIMSQFRLYKQALKDLVAMTATCRAWSTLLVSHWHSIYRTMEKFLPFVLCGEKNRQVRAIAMPASRQVLPRLSDAWCRLALKYVCKNGQKMANRAITRQRYVYNPQRTRGFKPATLYLARSRQTHVTAIKLGKDIDPTEDVVEYTLTEKIVDGHAYWRHKTMADVDAALDRRGQILADTHALQNELEKEAHGPLFFGMREL